MDGYDSDTDTLYTYMNLLKIKFKKIDTYFIAQIIV